MALVESSSYSHFGSIHSSRRPSWHSCLHEPSPLAENHDQSRGFDVVELDSALDGLHVDGIEALTTLENIDTSGPPPANTASSPASSPEISPRHSTDDSPEQADFEPESDLTASTKTPWQKWMRSFRRKANQRPESWDEPRGTPPRPWESDASTSRRSGHIKSSSGSSFGFVTAVRSASVSLASASATARSRRTTARSRNHLWADRSSRASRASMSGPRISEDGLQADGSLLVDAVSLERSLQRRRILEELIRTEESYIVDVRFLTHVYVTILAALPTLPTGLRSSINRNLNEIIELHEEILEDLHRVVPHADSAVPSALASMLKQIVPVRPGHRRGTSLDAVPEHYKRVSGMQETPGLLSDPQTAAQVARIFSKKMSRFFIYKEYGAKYELMIKDIASAHRTMPEWEVYQKGLETLAVTLGSSKSNGNKDKQSLTVGDLLVKPIQRVCKYPLLFSELLKYTTVSDCPNSHMEVDDTLMRLREATAEMNRATDDPQIKATLEKTWLLQDRLIFPYRKIDAASKNRVRSFGPIRLCGALHVCWQSQKSVEGQYFICLMYRDVFCLATAGKIEPIYTIHACVRLSSMRVEEADNGRGLQCHTAPFSWKVVFEVDHQLHEMIMTACGPKEEKEWRKRLVQSSSREIDSSRSEVYTCLDLDIKSLGSIFGKNNSVARSVSIRRALTVGPKSPLCQVVLKNTSVSKDPSSVSSITINRSQSLAASNSKVPVLAPSRAERARLEALLTDVWTRSVLPFPGMTARARSEHLLRSSTSSVMRKLSVASIASSFKRSASTSQKTKVADEGPYFNNLTRTYSFNDDASSATSTRLSVSSCIRESLVITTGQTPPVSQEQQLHDVVAGTEGGEHTEVPRFEVAEVLGGRHPYQLSLTDERGKTPVSLQAASLNSLQLTASTMSEKSHPLSLEKENRARAPSPSKLAARGRRPKPGQQKSERRVHALRSLFR